MRTPLGTPSARIHDWHSTDGTASASDHYPTSNSGEEELTYSSEFLSSDERTQKQQYSVSGLRDVAGPTYEVDFTQAAQSRTRIRQGQMGTAYTVVETLVRRIDVQRGAMGPESGNYYPPQRQANPQQLCQQPLAPTRSQPKPIPDRYTEDGRGVLFYGTFFSFNAREIYLLTMMMKCARFITTGRRSRRSSIFRPTISSLSLLRRKMGGGAANWLIKFGACPEDTFSRVTL